ncbi:low molecular weight protein-tyrosine-phosphatase [Shewanella sp.]|uniref:low molecular weight protein-tyrosine-phosphatase n=1 Tax=Shewanella sp. TaxID=50422 RepID=UPI003A969B21
MLPLLTANIRKILFVCMGNICRSPTAEAIARAKAQDTGLALEFDSAGTIDYHQGEQPDIRAQAALERRGIDFSGIRARKLTQSDFAEFDLILAADEQNLADLLGRCPEAYQHKLALIMAFGKGSTVEVPDPYYGGSDGFERVLDLLEEAIDGLFNELQATY